MSFSPPFPGNLNKRFRLWNFHADPLVTEWVSVGPHPSRKGVSAGRKTQNNNLRELTLIFLSLGFHRFWQRRDYICHWVNSRLETLEGVLHTLIWGPLLEGSISAWDLRGFPCGCENSVVANSRTIPLCFLLWSLWKGLVTGIGQQSDKNFLAQFLAQITLSYCTDLFSSLVKFLSRYFSFLINTIWLS